MRLLWQVSLCCLVAGGLATAQRGGGGMRGGGGNFGGFRGGFSGQANLNGRVGPIRGAFVGSGFPKGTAVPANGVSLSNTYVSFPFGAGFPAVPLGFPNGAGFPNNLAFSGVNNRFFFGRGGYSGYWGGVGAIGLPYFGSSYFPGYDYASDQPPALAFDYPQQPAVQPLSAERANPVMREYDQSGREIGATGPVSPAVAAAYPSQPAVQPRAAEQVHPVIREYDQSGHEILPSGSPLYLIAFADHTIHAAISYRADGNTLNYVTPEREQKAAPLNTVDRALSMELNRERQVPFELPAQ